MKNSIEYKKIPKGKEKERLYYTPLFKDVKINNNSTFIKELNKLANGDITEIDLNKIKKGRNKK